MSQPSHPSAESTSRKILPLSTAEDSSRQNFFLTKTTSLLSKSTEKKRRRKRQDPKAYLTDLTRDVAADEVSLMSSSDVETFQGKIVYNLDANSAYIIDNGEDESFVPLTEDTRSGQSTILKSTQKPKLLSISEKSSSLSTAKLNALTSSKLSKVLIANTEISSILSTAPTPKSASAASNPKIHSFRVVSAHDAIVSASQQQHNSDESHAVKKIQKPILMCFICKLSFGNTKSFSLHANAEHSLNLQDLELESSLLKREYSSAIIQRNMDEKPQISFLEPLDEEDQDSDDHKQLEANSISEDDLQSQRQQVGQLNASPRGSTEVKRLDDAESPSEISSTLICVAESHTSNELIVPTTDGLSSFSATDTFSCTTVPSTAALEKETPFSKTKDVDRSKAPTPTPTSPKRCISPEPMVDSENAASIEVNVSKNDSHSTDILSSNKIEPVDDNSAKKDYSSKDNITSRKDETRLICSKPTSPTTAVGNISAAVADFLQHQLQQLASPLRHIQSGSPPSSAASSTMITTTSTTISDHPSYSLSFLPTTTSIPHDTNLDSSHSSIGALSNDQNTNSVQFLNELLLQHQLAIQQQQIQHHLTCSDHPDFDGVDCKTCEVYKQLNSSKQQQQQGRIAQQTSTITSTSGLSICSNISASVSSNICSVSPTAASSVPPSTINVVNTPISSTAPSFTIGACSDHINGRPLGVDCVRCEMILTSARLNSGVQISSTRNSCKTLKCPQCNWHYKYQETLEIHMREKHPDGESACGYCLAGQQHPRLARGESYSCGYKPYRCEICNYSTTTKGNLSIHMQSDKHLNNMQELNNSQNMVAAAAAAAAVAAAASSTGNKLGSDGNSNSGGGVPKTLMPPNSGAGNSQNLQQPMSASSNIGSSGSSVNNVNSVSNNKPRPSFRCDICSYETSVARNLRIHMTSEKHTHNMAVLQNNIKHIQAFNFLQQQHQQATAAVAAAAAAAVSSNISPQIQGSATASGSNVANIGNIGTASSINAGDNSSYLPEVALADMAYNQALMIQLLQQNVAAAAAAQQQQQQQQQMICKSPNKMSQTSPTSQLSQSQQQRGSGSPINKSPTVIFSELNGTELCLPSSITTGDQFNEADMTPYGKPDLFPSTLYTCLVCSVFNTNSLDDLQQHLLMDRSRNSASSQDIMLLHNNNYICRLCNYKTNLKANFQLHSKTDKHLQKLNFINHIREGGPCNEYKLKFQQQQQFAANTVQLKCNCCDFYTNSIQKLSLHVQHMRHETMRTIFLHLRYLLMNHDSASAENPLTGLSADVTDLAPDCLEKHSGVYSSSSGCRAKALYCQLCNFIAGNLLDMIRHVKSLRHLQVEQFICLQRRSENLDGPSLDDIFKLSEQPQQQEQQVHEDTPLPYVGEVALDNHEDESYKSKYNVTTSSSSILTGISAVQPSSMRSSVIDEIINTSSKGDTNAERTARSPTLSSSLSSFLGVSDNDQKPLTLIENSESYSTIYKCNNNSCEFLAQTKSDLESHHEEAHQNSELNFITIPTNSAAIQAFQAAVAAATAAAAAAASCFAGKHSAALFSPQEHDDCPVAIKKERLDIEQAETETDDGPSKEHDEAHNHSQHMKSMNMFNERQAPKNNEEMIFKVQCPLCQDSFAEKPTLEYHLMKIHSVSQDGLMRLLQLVDKSGWPVSPKLEIKPSETSHGSAGSMGEQKTSPANVADYREEFLCQQCRIAFESEQLLIQHAQKSQHFTTQENGEYMCLAFDSNQRSCNLSFTSLTAMLAHYRSMHIRSNDGSTSSSNIVISERHVYKYRCKQCSLAFKTEAKLNTHALYHTMRDATKCNQCQRNFRSTQALQKHIEQAHVNRQPGSSNTLEQTPNDSNKVTASSGSLIDLGETSQKSPSPLVSTPTSTSALSLIESEKSIPPINQQHQVAAITAALLKQQQQQYCSASLEGTSSPSPLPTSPLDTLQNSQADILKQDATEQQQRLANFSNLQSIQNLQSFQGLQSLQQIQHHIPQLAAAAAASSLHMNPVDMLNLMQFHHLMSLNFMNLAPPLIFGGNTTTATTSGSATNTAPHSPNSAPLSIAPSSEISQLAPNITPTTQTSGMAALESTSQLLQQQQQQQKPQTSPGIAAAQLSTNQKRARTRITDEQLKILRAHFDINNSPSEESILEMSEKANLPMKVVKHWFRNTLFKERQRNKDSPYNFNNPPSTTLNLEEYERTGQAKVTSLSESNTTSITASSVETQVSSISTEAHQGSPKTTSENICNIMPSQLHASTTSTSKDVKEMQMLNKECLADNTLPNACNFLNVTIKTEPKDETISSCNLADAEKGLHQHQEQQLIASSTALAMLKKHQQRLTDMMTEHEKDTEPIQQIRDQLHHQHQHQHQHRPPVGTSPAVLSQMQSAVQQGYYSSYDTKSESGSSDILSRPPTPNSASAIPMHPYSNINDLFSQQLENMPSSNTSSTSQMGPPKNFQLTAGSGGGIKVTCGGGTFEKNSPSSQFDTNSNSSTSSSTSSGKRANRTRFTDYQIKVLQEFFENNSYPKDSDLEYLSKLLLLSPRVIVVWFQNARQKQRKIYENQPNNSLYETEEKKQNINYACKKCNLVFQRYYELIRHQKNHCFKEENNKKSAKAQIAAAQIAQNLSSEDSNSSMDISQQHHQHHAVAAATAAAIASNSAAVVGSSTGASIASNIMSGNGFSLIATSPQYQAFNKTTSLVDTFSPSTTPTPPSSQQRDRSNSIEQRHLQSSPLKQPKHECDKCKLSFTHVEHLREHQLLHIVNPGLFTMDSPLQNQNQNSQSQLLLDTSTNVYGPFSSILQNIQQAVQQQQQQHVGKKRKYSETSSNADDQSSIGGISSSTGDFDIQTKRYEFLYQYFMQNELNNEVRQQFQNQRLTPAHDTDMEMEFLMSYYQQCEMKKRSNYEYLFQYYVKNEQPPHLTQAAALDAESKPSFDFLLQYYQLHESKKFFQLDASPQPILDPNETSARYKKQQKFDDNRNREEAGKNTDEHIDNGNSNENTTDNVYRFFRMNNAFPKVSEAGLTTGDRDKDLKSIKTKDHLKDNININSKNFIGCEENDNTSKDNSSDEEKVDTQEMHKTDNQQFNQHGNIKQNEKNDLQYENLEDFLDATMIENNSQSLTFNEAASLPQNTQTPIHPLIEADEKNQTVKSSNSSNSCESKQNKRLRTTILPDQLNFLYECYQNESNPSRKMLEEIAKKVNLKKRVVQVWFQNARAKDKKSRNQRYIPQISDDSNTNTILKGAQISKDTIESKISDYKICQLSDLKVQPCNLAAGQIKELFLKSDEKNLCDLDPENIEIGNSNGNITEQNEALHFYCTNAGKDAENFLNMQTLKELVAQRSERKDFFMNSFKKSADIDDSKNTETSKISMYNNRADLKQHNQNMLINFNTDCRDTENDDDGDDIGRNIRNGNEVRNHNGNDIMKQMFKFNHITENEYKIHTLTNNFDTRWRYLHY